MILSQLQPHRESFEYHFFSPQKNLNIRYGVMNAQQETAKGVFLLLHGRSEFIENIKP